jgi:hypothetical protein
MGWFMADDSPPELRKAVRYTGLFVDTHSFCPSLNDIEDFAS